MSCRYLASILATSLLLVGCSSQGTKPRSSVAQTGGSSAGGSSGTGGASDGVLGTGGAAGYDGGTGRDSSTAVGGSTGTGGPAGGGSTGGRTGLDINASHGGATGAGDAGGNGGTTSAGVSVKTMALGNNHTCALLGDGTVDCWGAKSDPSGSCKLGGNCEPERFGSRVPLKVPGLGKVVGLAAAYNHTCALLEDGTVKCWGILDEDDKAFSTHLQAAASGTEKIVGIATGGPRSYCLFLGEGEARCQGDLASPSSITHVVTVAVGYHHFCTLLDDSTVQCWGQNDKGQLGDGTTTSSAGETAPSANSVTAASRAASPPSRSRGSRMPLPSLADTPIPARRWQTARPGAGA